MECAMRIIDLHSGMKHVNVEGRVINMNSFMLYIGDESGTTFVRYRGSTEGPVKRGDYVRIEDGDVVNYSGILQVKLGRNGKVTPLL